MSLPPTKSFNPTGMLHSAVKLKFSYAIISFLFTIKCVNISFSSWNQLLQLGSSATWDNRCIWVVPNQPAQIPDTNMITPQQSTSYIWHSKIGAACTIAIGSEKRKCSMRCGSKTLSLFTFLSPYLLFPYWKTHNWFIYSTKLLQKKTDGTHHHFHY